MKKIAHVVGARPQFIKLAPLSKAMNGSFQQVIIHTGQHYDETMSENFFRELNIDPPQYNLEVGSQSACRQIAQMLIGLEDIFAQEKPDCVVVYGDTNSTAAAAIAAIKTGTKLAHIEAGLREFNKYIPEESNKLITDILADFYFCPTDTAVDILRSMGITAQVYNIGDVMIDIIAQRMPEIKANTAILDRFGVRPRDYVFMTCHRAANTDHVPNLVAILSAAAAFSEKVIFPIHPRTRKVIAQNNLEQHIGDNMVLTEPLGYLDSQTLIHYARFVYTDSGGVTKEAYFHRTPGILLDTQTEWVETVKEGWNQQAGPDKNRIMESYRNLQTPTVHSNCLGDGHASEKIAGILFRELG